MRIIHVDKKNVPLISYNFTRISSVLKNVYRLNYTNQHLPRHVNYFLVSCCIRNIFLSSSINSFQMLIFYVFHVAFLKGLFKNKTINPTDLWISIFLSNLVSEKKSTVFHRIPLDRSRLWTSRETFQSVARSSISLRERTSRREKAGISFRPSLEFE